MQWNKEYEIYPKTVTVKLKRVLKYTVNSHTYAHYARHDAISKARTRRTCLPDIASSDGKFPEIFTGGNFPYDVRTSILTCLFLP
jgi:hypothetical protein